MGRNNQNKLSKKELNKKNEKQLKRKQIESSSSDDDSDSTYSENDSDQKLNVHEYRKFLSKILPSKHLNNKIKAGKRLQNVLNNDNYDEDSEEENIVHKKYNKKQKRCKKHTSHDDTSDDNKPTNRMVTRQMVKKNKRVIVSDDDDDDDDDDSGYEDDDDDEDDDSGYEDEDDYDSNYEDDDDDDDDNKSKSNKVNIIFTIGGIEDDDDDDEYWESCSDSQTENEDEPISSDTDSDTNTIDNEDKCNYKSGKKVIKNQPSTTKKGKITNKKEKTKNIKSPTKQTKEKNNNEIDIANNSLNDTTEVLTQLKEMYNKNPKNKAIEKCIQVYESDMKKMNAKNEKKIKKEKERNGRIFKKIIRDKNTMNDFEFYDKLEVEQQKKIIKELREINKITRVEKPYRLTLLESNIPPLFKAAAMKKIASLRYMEPGSGEYYKIKNWVDTFMKIPFDTHNMLPIHINDGVDKCHDFMANAQKTLDDAVYGLNDAKMQIMQLLGQLITNPKAIGSAVALHGPPGTGKTSLVKEGISKILNRPFAFIALGGATDSSFLEGHGYTYEGSTWGKIVQILIDSKCMNPVIYFDELDKISDTPKGEEIAGILTHLTDTTQNSQFHDKYFAEIDFDLSKCLFIFSYNDESKINPILKDRMYRIQTKGYNQKQKTAIANNYLLPKIREQVVFTQEEIIIRDNILQHIIESHCNKEDGVRNFKRCLEIIYTKLNLYRLMRPDSNLFQEDMSLNISFPVEVTKDIVDKLLKKSDNALNPSLYMLYS